MKYEVTPGVWQTKHGEEQNALTLAVCAYL